MAWLMSFIFDCLAIWLSAGGFFIIVGWGVAIIVSARWPDWWQRHIVAPCPPSLEALF